jgi:hypothetical protein
MVQALKEPFSFMPQGYYDSCHEIMLRPFGMSIEAILLGEGLRVVGPGLYNLKAEPSSSYQ